MQTHTSSKRGAPYKSPNNAAAQKAHLTRRDMAVINRIVKEFKSRSRVDIDKWRRAIKEAEDVLYPKRTLWAEITKDLDLDNHWSSQVLIRKLAVLCKDFKILDKATGKVNEEKTKMFKAPWFYRYLSVNLDAKFFGTQVVEVQDLLFGNYTKDAIYKVPTENVVPDKKVILLRASALTGYYYGEDDYIIQIDEDVFMGLLCKAAPQIIWKKNAQQSWAEFSEKFGIPMRYATTNKKDQQTIDRIEKMLDSLGSASRAIFPEGTTIDFKEADHSDAFQVFDKKIERCNSEISKLINGVTMMSDNGSSLSQSKVHFDVNKYIIKADSKDLSNDVNWNLFPKLNKIRFPIDPLKEEFQWDETETLGKKDQWAIVAGVLKFYDVDEDWLENQFGVPIIGKKENPITTPDPSTDAVINKASKMLEIIAGLKSGDQIDDKLFSIINEVSASFNKGQSQPAAVGSFDVAGYKKMIKACCDHHQVSPTASDNNSITSMFLKVVESFFANPINKPSTLNDKEWKDLYEHVSDKMWNGVQDGFGKTLSTPDLTTPDEEMLKKLRENMYVFSAFKNFQLMKSLNASLLDDNGKLREWSDFKERALELHQDYNINWLETEYNTAIASAQSAARWQQLWDERDSYDLIYRITDDDRNSQICEDLKDTVCSVDDPIVDTITPPNHFFCRSEWEQILKGSLVKTPPDKIVVNDIPKMFKQNIGKTGQVFTEDHPYWKGVSGTDKKALSELAKDTIKKIDE